MRIFQVGSLSLFLVVGLVFARGVAGSSIRRIAACGHRCGSSRATPAHPFRPHQPPGRARTLHPLRRRLRSTTSWTAWSSESISSSPRCATCVRMVETYLQDLKTDKDGNAVPVKDQYYLGRLDMSDGPEDTSFVGQPGFGHRMLNRLTGLYSLHFLPLGFAQMVVLDTDFQKKYYKFTFVRREFLGEVRCLVIDVEPRADSGMAASWAESGSKIRTTTWSASTEPILPTPRPASTCTSTVGV